MRDITKNGHYILRVYHILMESPHLQKALYYARSQGNHLVVALKQRVEHLKFYLEDNLFLKSAGSQGSLVIVELMLVSSVLPKHTKR